jgi:hypothetical protein
VNTRLLAFLLWAFLLVMPTFSMGGTAPHDRLICHTSPTTEATYAHDALDRRIEMVVDGVVTACIYNMSPDDPLACDGITLEFNHSILTPRCVPRDSAWRPSRYHPGHHA